MRDDYDDVRKVDPAFDEMAEMLTPDDLAAYADDVRGSMGYALYRHNVAWQDFIAAWAKVYADAGASLIRFLRRT